jgi:KduI/IolB family
MKLIKADHHRRVEIPGLPAPARRPVDIDKSQTGFANLRSLRIYSFDVDSVINGHAEEDEVLIVVLAGSVELTMSDHNSADSPRPFTLSAASEVHNDPCAAYLPPHAAYQLIPQSDADVAYARATPADGRPPRIFTSHLRLDHAGVALVLEESTYPQLLRLRLLQITPVQHEIAFTPIEESENRCEALIHIRTVPTERVATITTAATEPAQVNSWDTLCVMPGDRPLLRVAAGSSALVLTILAA